MTERTNLDADVVRGFGDEWTRFDQTTLSEEDRTKLFDSYFGIFPWTALPNDAVGADMGCGTGRWATMVAPRVGRLYCVDPSEALNVARRALAGQPCEFVAAGVSEMELPPLDFAYSLGVLHHIPDTLAGLKSCTAFLKPGAPFLLYLYYALENRPAWFRAIWKATDLVRGGISRLPSPLMNLTTDAIAALVYFPISRLTPAAKAIGLKSWPLSAYADKTFYTLRTDSRDRFGTRLEQRFTREQIKNMMEGAGLERVTFSEKEPFWVAVGYKRPSATAA